MFLIEYTVVHVKKTSMRTMLSVENMVLAGLRIQVHFTNPESLKTLVYPGLDYVKPMVPPRF
jgi:hypothetical protein